MRKLILLALLAVSLTWIAGRPASAATPPTAPPGFSITTYGNLGMQPYGLTNFVTLPGDGHTMLATTKYGDLHRLTISTDEQTMSSTVIGHVPVYYQGDRGLLGITLAADYARSGNIFLLYDYANAQGQAIGTLKRYHVTQPTAPRTLVGPDATLMDNLPSWSPVADQFCTDSHTIGTVVAAPDGTLFVGNGDGAGYCTPQGQVDLTSLQAQDVTSVRGKIFHINADGTPAADTIPGTNGVWAYGVRNPFRFDLAPGTNNTLMLGDVGWNRTEELDIVHPGDNLGWPCLEGTTPPPLMPSFAQWHAVCDSVSGTTPPVYTWDHVTGYPGSASVGGAVYTAGNYPDGYQGAEFFGDYGRGQIYVRDVNGNVSTFGGGSWGAITAIHTGLDGDIFVADISTANDQSDQTSRILRIHYNAGQPVNQLPVAVAQASPAAGKAPLTVNFTSSGSQDPDGQILAYTWDFGDSSAPVAGSSATHTYAQPGSYNARLTVTDNQGGVGVATVTVDTTNNPPVLSVVQPQGPFHIGDQVHVQATAFDPDGGPVTLTYQSVLHHCPDGITCHTHPGAVQSSPDFVIPDHGDNFYLAVLVIATDQTGAFVTDEVDFTVATTPGVPPVQPPPPPADPPPAPGTPTPPAGTDLLYQAVSPWRVFDTRDTGVKLQAGVPLVFSLSGQSAAMLNVTVTEPEGDGFLRIYPCNTAPAISTVNYKAGENASNLAFVEVPTSGNVCIQSQQTTHVIVDEEGFFRQGDGLRFTPAQARIFDTRKSVPLGANQQLVFNNASAPADAQAMLATLTATEAKAPGYVRAYACGIEDGTSNVDYDTGQTVANLAAAPVTNGTTCFRSFAPTNLVTDLVGWFSPSGLAYQTFTPQRLYDTRVTGDRLAPGQELALHINNLDPNIQALALNVTAVNPGADGFVQVYPCGANPGTSILNYVAHQVAQAGMTVVQVPASDTVCFRSFASADLVIDLQGGFIS